MGLTRPHIRAAAPDPGLMNPSVLNWLREHKRLPRARSVKPDKRTEEQAAEIKVAKALARLRAKAAKAKLPQKVKADLDEVSMLSVTGAIGAASRTDWCLSANCPPSVLQAFSGWLEAPKGPCRYEPAAAVEDVRTLVKWCGESHGGTLVRKRFNEEICTDKQGHDKMAKALRRLKEAAKGPRPAEFREAFGTMDKEFGPIWRPSEKRDHKGLTAQCIGCVGLTGCVLVLQVTGSPIAVASVARWASRVATRTTTVMTTRRRRKSAWRMMTSMRPRRRGRGGSGRGSTRERVWSRTDR